MTRLAGLNTKRVILQVLLNVLLNVLQLSSNRPTARRAARADLSIFWLAVNTLATSFD